MDFFLDTGIFLGISDGIDKWNSDCKSFFTKYPFQSNNYYTAEMVKTELRCNMRNRRRRSGSESVLRSIEQQIKLYLAKMEDIVSYGKHLDYENIHKAVEQIIPKNKANDIVIVTNAMIWSYDLPLNYPTFATVDFNDMINNRTELKKQASLAINGRPIPLEIESPGKL